MSENQFQTGEQTWLERNKTAVIFISVFFAVLAVGAIIFAAVKMAGGNRSENPPAEIPAPEENKTATTEGQFAGLPIGEEAKKQNGNGANGGMFEEKEKIFFGNFYKPPAGDFKPQISDYLLPLKVKTEVANYYDLSRKINLDAGLESLSNNGFAIIDNPFAREADNFYLMYNKLDSQQVPILITGDFLLYYYQNVMKEIFKNIESSVFYENVWETNKKLYSIARERYEKRLEKNGPVNDLNLEAARLELAYFATALLLLAPTEEQIVQENNLNKTAGFTPGEAADFSFQLPEYLEDDVAAEVKLIRGAKEKTKSPVLLYEKNYAQFAVPADYKTGARLNNFYLAARWLNSVFPLYYRDAACPKCLLDKDDWRLNMYAAFLISEDLSANQDLQNRWAKVYKIMSFFQGLRNDLNYLYYQEALASVFGPDKKIGDILGGDQLEADANLAKLQEKLASFNFSSIEGGLDKNSTSTRPFLGLKMLVESYWPNNYIFNRLSYPATGFLNDSKSQEKRIFTSCPKPDDPEKRLVRCFGFGLDVINLLDPALVSGNEYFSVNANYENYQAQAEKMRQELDKFDDISWHNSNYWAILDVAKKFLRAPEEAKPLFMKNSAWRQKDLNMALSAWVNLQLPADVLAPYKEEASFRLNQYNEDNPYAAYKYVEPNLNLIRELAANAEMVSEMLSSLEVDEAGSVSAADLKSLRKNFSAVEAIVKKELTGEDLPADDYKFLAEFAKEFSIKEKGAKTIELPALVGYGTVKEKLENVKLLVVAYRRGDKNFFAVGPIFDYQESNK